MISEQKMMLMFVHETDKQETQACVQVVASARLFRGSQLLSTSVWRTAISPSAVRSFGEAWRPRQAAVCGRQSEAPKTGQKKISITYLPHKAAAEVSKDKEPIGRECAEFNWFESQLMSDSNALRVK